MKVFIIESPNPNDLLRGTNEADSLLSIGKMFGHKTASFFVKNKNEFDDLIIYLSDFEIKKDDQLCFHISCHGNEDGIGIGKNFLSWDVLYESLKPVFQNSSYNNRYIVIISACGANAQKLTSIISKLDEGIKSKIYPPSYLFVYDDNEVQWKDALLSWTILYHQLGKDKIIDKSDIQDLLGKMKIVEFGNLLYFRWDKDVGKYLRFRPEDK